MSLEESAKKFGKKLDDLMAEMADEMIDDPMRKDVEDKLKSIFQKEGIPFGTKEVKAFYEGLTMGIALASEDKSLIVPLMLVLRGIVSKSEKAISKAADAAVEKLMQKDEQ